MRHWAVSLLSRVAVDHRISPARFPTILFVEPSLPWEYGGRYSPKRNAIAVIDSGGEEKVRAVLLHEVGHFLLTHKPRSGHHGQHDAAFFAVAESLYRDYGVTPAVARSVEDNGYPREWNNHKRWPR